jgi:hypothetical protein
VIVTGGAGYALLTPDILRALAGAPASCTGKCGKYAMVPPSQVASLVGSWSLAGEIQLLLQSLSGLRQAGTATVSGQRVVVLRGPDNEVLDVAATGTPYPVRITGGSAAEGTLISTYSQWNSVPPVDPPPPADIVGPAAG